MPRFYFHVRGARHELSRDELGLDFPDVETAYREAFDAARDVKAVLAAHGRHPRGYIIEVVNAADELVFRIPFSATCDDRTPRPTKPILQ
ncbi:hypothetical protein [Microvirga sp. TS319]|uniref:DUF6894 family protein n=1 Tax=Microvirga sp. TS319 TaxID=3241165 RepID=UPI003519E076